MSMSIVTGYAGNAHVTSAQAGAGYAGIVGVGRYVFEVGEQFAYELISNNTVRIKNGFGINQGRIFGINVNDYQEVTIDNGLAGVGRKDLIVARYTKTVTTGIETCTLAVVKGTSSASPVDPIYTVGNILQGATSDDFPLYRVTLNGLNVASVTPLFEPAYSCETLYDLIYVLQTTVGTISSSLTHKFLGQVDGTASIALPSSFNKLHVRVTYGVLHHNFKTVLVPEDLPTNTTEYFNIGGGYYDSGNNSLIRVKIVNRTTISISDFTLREAGITYTAGTLIVWYE